MLTRTDDREARMEMDAVEVNPVSVSHLWQSPTPIITSHQTSYVVRGRNSYPSFSLPKAWSTGWGSNVRNTRRHIALVFLSSSFRERFLFSPVTCSLLGLRSNPCGTDKTWCMGTRGILAVSCCYSIRGFTRGLGCPARETSREPVQYVD